MKKLLKTLLLVLFLAGNILALPFKQDDFVVITDGVVYLTANSYLNAQSVDVELLNASQGVQASTSTQAGNTVSFTLLASSKYLRSTYHIDRGDYIVITDIINP